MVHIIQLTFVLVQEGRISLKWMASLICLFYFSFLHALLGSTIALHKYVHIFNGTICLFLTNGGPPEPKIPGQIGVPVTMTMKWWFSDIQGCLILVLMGAMQFMELWRVLIYNELLPTLLLLLSSYVEWHSGPDCLYIWKLIKNPQIHTNSQNLVSVAIEQDFYQFSSRLVCMRISDA